MKTSELHGAIIKKPKLEELPVVEEPKLEDIDPKLKKINPKIVEAIEKDVTGKGSTTVQGEPEDKIVITPNGPARVIEVVGDVSDDSKFLNKPSVEEVKEEKRKYDFLHNIFGDIIDKLTGDVFSPEQVALAMDLEKDHSPKYIKRVIGDSWVADQVIKFLDENPTFNFGAKTVVSTRTKNKAEALRKFRAERARMEKPGDYRRKTGEIEKAQMEDFMSDTDKVLKRKAAEQELLKIVDAVEKARLKDEWKDDGDVINEALKKMRY